MPSYQAPLADIRFCLEAFDYERRVTALPGYEEATVELAEAALEEAAKFCENELAPLNASGDREGCAFEDGAVRTPEGFKEAYAAYAEAGWVGLSASPDYGGQGLPKTLNAAFGELLCSTNLSFAIYPGLTRGGLDAIDRWADDDIKTLYGPKLASGAWSATMNLTEPHCGTDLGLIKTRAEPRDDGTYAITGQKVYISGGEQDLTENIVHLVLAKLPDAPPGVRGISLFLVPKFLVDAHGELGARNGVRCVGVEDKMGIHAASTCAMAYEEATAHLIGEPHGGLKAMFTMMNEARLMVAIQGLGLAEAAYQAALDWSKERLQGRALVGPLDLSRPADPILVHPPVKDTLLRIKALNEGCRALALWTAIEADVAERSEDPAERARSDDLVALMTPILKSFLTDHGSWAANAALQLHGGYGYIRGSGVEQLARDARIAQIYEGANEIQALDLVGRKMAAGAGRMLRRFFHPVRAFIAENAENPAFEPFRAPLEKAFSRLQQASATIARRGMKDADEGAAAAPDYLRLFALTAIAYLWARMALASEAKAATARYYFSRVLPDASPCFARIMAGKAAIAEFEDAAL